MRKLILDLFTALQALIVEHRVIQLVQTEA